jgi:transposase
VIRSDAVWLATQPLDMRVGPESALAWVVQVFGAARPHQVYLFANRRANRLKVLVNDGIGVWLAARQQNAGRFIWLRDGAATVALVRPQCVSAYRDPRFRDRDHTTMVSVGPPGAAQIS